MGRKQVVVLEIITLLVATVSGLAWYHQKTYHQLPNTPVNDVTNEQKNNSSSEPVDNQNTDLTTMVEKLHLSAEKQDIIIELIQGFNKELQTSNQSLNELFLQSIQDTSDMKDNLLILQRSYGIKLEQFKLDLSDEIGDVQADNVLAMFRQITPPVLLQNTTIAPVSHDGMNMDM